MRNDRYDFTADTYSFGVVLVAMLRVDKTVVDFFFKELQRKMRRKSRQGIGIGSLNRYLDKGWRPPLPVELYPGMKDLISRCWAPSPDKRPNFKTISDELQSITLEVQTNPEPIFGSGVTMPASGEGDRPVEEEDVEGMETQRGGEEDNFSEGGVTDRSNLQITGLTNTLMTERGRVQELEEMVEAQKKEIDELKTMLNEKEKEKKDKKLKAEPTIVDFGGGPAASKAQPIMVDFGFGAVGGGSWVSGGGGLPGGLFGAGGGREGLSVSSPAAGGHGRVCGGDVGDVGEEDDGGGKANPFANIFP